MEYAKRVTEDGRTLTVRGPSAVDLDCLVAHYDDSPDVAMWIVEHSGAVIDKRNKSARVYAKRIDLDSN